MTCLECNYSFELPESKIPASTFKVKCPACHKVFQANVRSSASPQRASDAAPSIPALWKEMKPEVETLVKAELEAVRADILLSLASLLGRQSPNMTVHSDSYTELHALVCQSNPAVAQHLSTVLQRMKYSVYVSSSCADALSRLERGIFNVITTDLALSDDPEAGIKILAKINSRKMDERRKMFVAVVSDQVKTTGVQSAFFQGANILINESNIENFESLMQEGMRYYAELYGNYINLLKQAVEHL